MKMKFKESLFLVIAARTWREARSLWKMKRLEYNQEKESEIVMQKRQKLIEVYLASNDIPKLQIGAGNNPITGWLNTDLEPLSEDILYINALEAMPFDDQVMDYVFCEHMIEHIDYKGGLFMLRECHRILKPGGKIRIATPDVERIVGLYDPNKTDFQRRYLEWSAKVGIGLYSSEKSEMQRRRPEWDIDPVHVNRYFPDASQDPVCFVVNNFFRSYGHRFLYDKKTLSAAMSEAGFINLGFVSPGESNDTNLRGLEAHHRIIGEELNQFETMVLEGIRP